MSTTHPLLSIPTTTYSTSRKPRSLNPHNRPASARFTSSKTSSPPNNPNLTSPPPSPHHTSAVPPPPPANSPQAPSPDPSPAKYPYTSAAAESSEHTLPSTSYEPSHPSR